MDETDGQAGPTPASLREQADAIEAEQVAAAAAEARAQETPEQAAVREQTEQVEAAQKAQDAVDAEAHRVLFFDPTPEMRERTVGLEGHNGEIHGYHTITDREDYRAHRLNINGRNYEHCREDAAGRWVYRNQ